MYLLAKSKRAKDPFESQRILLKRIKDAIANEASKFGDYRQQVLLGLRCKCVVFSLVDLQDAHELLGQCLSQLREEVIKVLGSSDSENKEVSIPLARLLFFGFYCPNVERCPKNQDTGYTKVKTELSSGK